MKKNVMLTPLVDALVDESEKSALAGRRDRFFPREIWHMGLPNLKEILRPLGLVAGFIVALWSASCVLAADDQAPFRSASIAGSTEELYGTWHGGDKAADAIYGRMNISESSMTWKGNNNDPRCAVSYQRIREDQGVNFRDQTDNNYVTAPGEYRYTTFLLKIRGGKCALGITHFRLTLDRDFPGYLAMVKYKGMANAIGHIHFYRN